MSLSTLTQGASIRAKNMLAQMNDLRREKLEGWTVVPVDKFPPLITLDHMTYLGSFSWTQPHNKVKFIKKNFVHNLGGGLVSPSDIARDYLSIKFDNQRMRCNSYQYKTLVRGRKHQPLYAEPVFGMDAYYFDLKSAYWQILMCGGWDVEYSPNGFLSVRSDVFDFPCPHIKLARNSLVSMGLPSQGTIYHPEKGLQRLRGGSSTVNLVLWGFAMDLLHAIAYEMVNRAGAVYVNTDGYIIPKYLAHEAEKIADEWNVTLVIKHDGVATVRGAGDYDIDKKRSARQRVTSHPHEYIVPPNIDFFKKRWNYFSDRIDLDFNPMKMEE